MKPALPLPSEIKKNKEKRSEVPRSGARRRPRSAGSAREPDETVCLPDDQQVVAVSSPLLTWLV